MSMTLEEISTDSYAPVRAKEYVESGTALQVIIGFFASIGLMLLTVLVTYGLALLIWPLVWLTYILGGNRARAQLHGSALKVGPNQFPEIYHSCLRMSDRLGLPDCPDVYIIEDNTQNAFAMKRGGKYSIILIDDIVHGAETTGNMEALDFIIAHELAHHALGHTKGLRAFIASKYRPLSRLDEFSCDAVAHALVADSRVALDALSLLLVGPQLFPRVNKDELHQQALDVMANKHSKKAEGGQTHPLLLRRYARLAE